MDAWVTVRFRINNVCHWSDLTPDYTFEDCVRDMIDSEGIFGLVDDGGQIIQILEVGQ